MKQRFLNQKLGKRTSRRAGLMKAAKAVHPAGSLRPEPYREPAGKPHRPA